MTKSRGGSRTTEELKKLRSHSDWQKAAAMTDAEIAAAVGSDPHEAGLDDTWMKNAIVTRPNKRQRVYALYEAYVVDYFKRGGRGYQSRMNAVLKAYVDAPLAKERERAQESIR